MNRSSICFAKNCKHILRTVNCVCSIFAWLYAFLCTIAVALGNQTLTADQVAFFESNVRPLLIKHCYKCHSDQSAELQGGLRLDTRAGALAGGDSGPAVVPGDVGRSLIVSAMRYDGIEMPPDKRLPNEAIAVIEKWIQLGAPDPRDGPAGGQGKSKLDWKQAAQFWSFQPVVDAHTPNVINVAWARNVIDRFVLNKLEAAKLRPAPVSSKLDWIRRVTFDLHGLPPTPDEIEAFVSDTSPDCYERLVDRLLSSPRYGERWGQHWLDVVRFAETEGFEYDRTVLGAWRFRDYVIDAFNVGTPFDQFLTEQIAGDELPSATQNTFIAATFHRLGTVRRNAGNQEVAGSRNEVLTERTDIVGSAVLGLTLACARCHDHKFDPLLQKDYYSLQAYFAASHEHEIPLVSADEQQSWEKQSSAIQKKIDQLKKDLAGQTGAAERATLQQIDSLEKELPPPVPVISTVRNDFDKQTPIHVLKRGEWSLPGERAFPEPPRILQYAITSGSATPASSASGDASDPASSSVRSAPRLKLAGWLTDLANPLTARVMVNRVWQYHFGRGIVASPNDFGINGQRPSHPELLDYLASRLMVSGWQLKSLHRQIVLSGVYRQGVETPDAETAIRFDPQNTLLWRFNQRRLSAEEIRDAMLAVSGNPNYVLGGPSVMLPVEQPLIDQLYKPSQWQVAADAGQHARRSIYLIAKRNLRLPFMEVFDQPSLQVSCARRESSTHAPQALELLNGQISNQLAAAFADRLLRETGTDTWRTIDSAFQLACGRTPTDEERQIAMEFLRTEPLTEFAIAMFNLNAFLYVR